MIALTKRTKLKKHDILFDFNLLVWVEKDKWLLGGVV